ncbi:hypothetical protein HU200_029181 [Digitaria exilis]|uniref:PGG domain-containing protein n=1 Tax=Digitaria exilis TaxID=1010633 RepID=A0A835BTG6_9POAL|nr:hypothetical protein HU200_029181 [Digitaria exilis]
MDRQQQHVELAHAYLSSGSPPASATAVMQPNGSTRLVQMCPYLYRAAFKGRTEEVMALLLRQHAARAERYQQATGQTHSKADHFLVSGSAGIIQHGPCDILEVSTERNTVLHLAAEQGHDELIQELFLRFKEQSLLSRRNSALDTPLHCAARAGHNKAVVVLLQFAEDCGESIPILGCKNEAGDTALHLAARHGHRAIVEFLVSAAEEMATEVNNAGVSPLYLAVLSGSVQAVKAIISKCRDVSSAGPSLQNALHAAVFRSSEMVNVLLEWKPALADQVDCNGSSPLHFASSNGDHTVVQAILRAAPPLTAYRKDSGGLSALHVAAQMGHHYVVKDMLDIYPDAAELRDNHGGTFVHAAARAQASDVVCLAIRSPMLRAGFLDEQDRDGNTPLHFAVAAGAPGVVEALIRKGKVRTDVLNNDGHTAFDVATGSTGFFTMVKLVVNLVAFGAQLGPQRHDHMKPWSDHSTVEKIGKTSDSLAVVAVLVATAGFTAGFNMPGGYGDTGEASLARKATFKAFVFLDTVAAATSMAAAILFVYGKVSRSGGGSWKSFAWALQCMWVSLFCLLLAFYAALVSVETSKAVRYGFVVVCACMAILLLWTMMWIGTSTPKVSTILRFLWQSKGRHIWIIKRLYPHVGASVFHFCVFIATSYIAFVCLAVTIEFKPAHWGLGTSAPASAPSPL